MHMPVLGTTPPPIKNRSLDLLSTDAAAVRAIAQAAVSVELFTIPLYMNSMYSLYGTHQINSKGADYYKGRQWPGMSTSAKPANANEKAFNIIFSVFIQEMLHLQMAANLATAIGIVSTPDDIRPSFTGNELQTPAHGWKCYGPDLTTIPHIVDLQDTAEYKNVKVNLEALNDNQCELFLAIEQPEERARKGLSGFDNSGQKYFPTVPFAGWTPAMTNADLPLFGTIGHMYECYAQYISIEYTDGKTLWEKLFVKGSVQQDMFNIEKAGHPKREFAHFSTLFGPDEQDGGQIDSFNKAIDMMCAITDQGEGSSTGIKRYRRARGLMAVQPDYREDDAALKVDYPAYANDGGPAESRDAAARFHSAALDHFERFGEVKALWAKGKGEVSTWQQWHAAGNRWSKEMLINPLYDPASAPKNIPTPEDVAGALNRLKEGGERNHALMSTVSTGAIFGITSVLDTYWQVQKTDFPYPSMVGSGDRMSICWAVFGSSPDLSGGVPLPDQDTLYHACQGMNLDEQHADADPGKCAAIAVYHTCRGSNGCHAQGGCGFAQLDSGGGSCGGSSCGAATAASAAATGAGATNLCGAPPVPTPSNLYSAPSDNKCATFGGCAVPISASQLFPNTTPEEMTLYNFGPGPQHEAVSLDQTMGFALADGVYDKAWQAYTAVMKARGKDAGDPPKPTDLRLALPPST